MIPRFGRVLPFITVVIGIFSVDRLWKSSKLEAVALGIVTAYLVYLMFRRHHKISPKKTAYYLFMTALAIGVILASAYFVFF